MSRFSFVYVWRFVRGHKPLRRRHRRAQIVDGFAINGSAFETLASWNDKLRPIGSMKRDVFLEWTPAHPTRSYK
jgi:hypothetical protein